MVGDGNPAAQAGVAEAKAAQAGVAEAKAARAGVPEAKAAPWARIVGAAGAADRAAAAQAGS